MAKKISNDAGDKNLINDEDYEYEKSLAEHQRELARNEEEAMQRAIADRKKREQEEKKARDKQIAQDKLELLKIKNDIIDEDTSSIKEEHEEVRKLKGAEWVANVWYHNKVWIIFGAFILMVVGFITYSEIKREKPDLTVMVIANNGLAERQQELEEFFEKYTDDLDGNGYVHVQIIMMPLNPNSTDYQTQNTNTSKFLANLQMGESVIVITDSNTEDQFKGIMKSDLDKDFPDNPYIDELGLSLNMKLVADELKFENMPNDVHISLRTPTKTLNDSLETMQYSKKWLMMLPHKPLKTMTLD